MMDGLGWFASVLKYWVPLRCKTRCGILARWEWRLLWDWNCLKKGREGVAKVLEG